MPAKTKLDEQTLLKLVSLQHALGQPELSSSRLVELTGAGASTVKRVLERLCDAGQLIRSGRARATRYRLPATYAHPANQPPGSFVAEPEPGETTPSLRWSAAAEDLRRKLGAPLGSREPVTYKREFVDRYVPNESSLLPLDLARDLAGLGRMEGQQPAGTYARKVLEQLLIDLSWSSSRLEGNRYSRLDTEQLFKSGLGGEDGDAVMLLNHKNAIEFMVDAVPEQGLTMSLVRNLHAVLLQDLLADSHSLGAIRQKVVNISDTVYLPTQVPSLLSEMLERVLRKARLIKNPVESAFFLWVNIAYLQPFEDGNKRTSRLCANIPLMLYNCAPLSFMDVDRHDYADAMLGVYELQDAALAIDLFDWTYRRSCRKYAVVLEAMGAPDPVRLRYREQLGVAIRLVVCERKTFEHATAELGLTAEQAPGFAGLLREELQKLESFNCARYRLRMNETSAWIEAGRPA